MEYVETAEERVGYEMARARRYGLPLTLVLVKYELKEGTDPLGLLDRKVRAADIVKPFSETVALLLPPHTGLDGGLGFGRRCTTDMQSHDIPCSVGVASISSNHKTGADLINEALEAVQQATPENPVVASGETSF